MDVRLHVCAHCQRPYSNRLWLSVVTAQREFVAFVKFCDQQRGRATRAREESTFLLLLILRLCRRVPNP